MRGGGGGLPTAEGVQLPSVAKDAGKDTPSRRGRGALPPLPSSWASQPSPWTDGKYPCVVLASGAGLGEIEGVSTQTDPVDRRNRHTHPQREVITEEWGDVCVWVWCLGVRGWVCTGGCLSVVVDGLGL